MGLPWRYALGCMDQLGLILRAEIIWSKPNGLPESVRDRVRRSHEQVFHFTRLPRYFSAVDEIREPHAATDDPRARKVSTACKLEAHRGDGPWRGFINGIREPQSVGEVAGVGVGDPVAAADRATRTR